VGFRKTDTEIPLTYRHSQAAVDGRYVVTMYSYTNQLSTLWVKRNPLALNTFWIGDGKN